MSDQGPLPLSQILREEYKLLYPEKSGNGLLTEYIDCRFQQDHIRNPARFAMNLESLSGQKAPGKSELPLRDWVHREAPGELTKYLELARKADADTIPQPPESLQDVIIEQLNKLLEAPDLGKYFDAEQVHSLREEISRKTGDVTLSIHNRYLLEAAFPEDIIPLNETLSGIYPHLHRRNYTALCISGGGIRSGTFALGVIQGLARCGLLENFDYLSTVSGGGYIGSWLTSWIHRHRDGEAGVIRELKESPNSKTEIEPEPIRHLRSYSNYLSPKLGLLSADTWTLVAIYVRNLILNWLVLVPLLAAVLMIPRIYAGIVNKIKTPTAGAQYLLNHHSVLMALVIIGTLLGVLAIGYIGYNRPSVAKSGNASNGQEEKSWGQGRYVTLCLVPLLLSAILLTITWGWYRTIHPEGLDLIPFVLFGIAINVVGYVAWTMFKLRSFKIKNLRELIVAAVAGSVAGWLIWLASDASFFFQDTGEIRLAPYVCLAVPMLLGIFLLSAFLFNGLISFWTTDDDREWWSRSDAWALIAIVGWAAINALVIFGPIAIGKAQTYVVSVGGLSGLLTLWFGRSANTSANNQQSKGSGISAMIKEKALSLAAPIFAIFLLALLALTTTALLQYIAGSALSEWLASTTWHPIISIPEDRAQDLGFTDYFSNAHVIQWAPLKLVVGFTILLLLISFSMAWFININRYSLHSMYRNRLIRAYLGASNLDRKPNKFTGFDPTDNIQMHELWPETKTQKSRKKLFHIVNIALNLVEGDNLAWQQRKAESFTVSPLHSGSYRKSVGYRRSDEYGGKANQSLGKKGGISLGTAVAISGAAASPNMGYHSSTFVTFLMTLFNARLGWWLGNPGQPGENTYHLEGPYFALKPLIAETLGLTNDKNPYVYLSDGGHFENLGLYEMVLRRCRFIVVSDGSQDDTGNFESLGNAVRKIRIDLGIPIEFSEKMCIYSRTQKRAKGEVGKYCAIGKIRYSCVDGNGLKDGIVLYIKPAFYGDEPRDIYEYAQANPLFPHESTADQFFTESQFESYRMLGSHITEILCQGREKETTPDLNCLLREVVSYLYPDDTLSSGSKSKVPEWLNEWLKPVQNKRDG